MKHLKIGFNHIIKGLEFQHEGLDMVVSMQFELQRNCLAIKPE